MSSLRRFGVRLLYSTCLLILARGCGQSAPIWYGAGASSSTAHGDGGNVDNAAAGGDSGDPTAGGQGDSTDTDGTSDVGEPNTGRPVGTESYDCQPAEGDVPALKLTELVSGLDEPIQVTHAPNDDRLFIAQRDGKIMLFVDGALQESPFLDLADIVVSDDDADSYGYADWALNGVAFHPDYEENGLLFVYYNTMPRNGYAVGDALLAQYTVSPDPNLADPESERVLLHIPRDGHIDHHGGGLAFGGDQLLYLALGDGNSKAGEGQAADPDGNGQNPATLLGSLLRIQPDLEGGYTSPKDNLKATLPEAAPEVWDYGLRNPFRISFDGCTGALYIADVGFESFEEVNIERGGQGHNNYGWPLMEGPECEDEASCATDGLTLPAYSYAWLAESKTTIIGGAVYRGSAIPALRGKYVFADFLRNTASYLSFDETTGQVSGITDISGDLDYPSSPTCLANGSDGELYLTSYSNGALYRLDAE